MLITKDTIIGILKDIMGRRKKVDSENIRNEKIKTILMCDVDVAMLSERLPHPPTFHNTTHQPPSRSCQLSPSAWLTPYPRLLVPMPLRLDQPTA
ncbi:hypothetical protein CWI36_3373p0010, partial [Hamiltosporidium magnivora]